MSVAEVILVTQNEDVPGSSTLIHTCLSEENANHVLADISFANLDEGNCRAYRGILTDAKAIPEKFLGCTPYIIVQLRDAEATEDYVEALFEKAPLSPEKVKNRIQELLSQELVIDDENGIPYSKTPKIDDVFIFFGVQLPLTFHIGIQDTDEEFEERLISLRDSLCGCITDIQIPHENNSKGVQSDMSTKVQLIITPRAGKSYMMEGRLLGCCITEEATKIVQNKDISERIHTSETQPMKAVISQLTKIEDDNQRIALNLRVHGHIVITIDAVKASGVTVHTEVISRQLYISPPITLTSEQVCTASSFRAVFDCADGTTITMKEQVVKEVTYV